MLNLEVKKLKFRFIPVLRPLMLNQLFNHFLFHRFLRPAQFYVVSDTPLYDIQKQKYVSMYKIYLCAKHSPLKKKTNKIGKYHVKQTSDGLISQKREKNVVYS
jgi:hypothetical protein